MPIKEADPEAKSLGDAWAAAMTGPVKPREAAPPPEVDRDAPHGRGDDGQPLAPYGHNKDGSVRKSAAGRKPKADDKPRVIAGTAETVDGPPKTAAAAAAAGPKDYSAGLMEAGETIWFGGSVLAKVGPQIPIVGRMVPGTKLSATMAVFDDQRPALAAALNLAAQHDARARRIAEKLSSGQISWAISVMFMTAPFVGAVAAIWQGDQALADRELPSLAALAKRNDEQMDKWMGKIAAQMQAAQAQAAGLSEDEYAAALAQLQAEQALAETVPADVAA